MIIWWIDSSKEQQVFETEFFCNIMNVLLLLISLMHTCWIKALTSFINNLTAPKPLSGSDDNVFIFISIIKQVLNIAPLRIT